MTQNKRLSVLNEFKKNETRILVCTDVAARGIDVKGVSHVYNYDIPKTSNEYIHRVGRTARADSEGLAINILSGRDYENFRNVLNDKLLKITQENIPEFRKIYIKVDKFKPRTNRNFNFNKGRNYRRNSRR